MNKYDKIQDVYREDDFTSLAFTELSDVPASYTSQALKALRVNSGATALEFYTPTDANDAAIWGNLTGNISDQEDLQSALDAKGVLANPLSQFATTTSLQLLGVISDETGSGSLVFATSPTLV